MNKHRIILLSALALPFLILGMISIKETHNQSSGEIWRVKITGYDPRDYVYGRYLRYQIDWERYIQKDHNAKLHFSSKDSLCLTRNANSLSPVITSAHDKSEQLANCTGVLHAGRSNKHWNTRRRQYYIPESYANALDWAFRQSEYNFEIDIRSHKSGLITTGALYINGQEMSEAMPEINVEYKRYNFSSNKTNHQIWQVKAHKFESYFENDNRTCLYYQIPWQDYGAPALPAKQNEKLCLNRNGSTPEPQITLTAIGRTNIVKCDSILTASSYSSWNTPYQQECYASTTAEKLLAAEANNDDITVEFKIFSNTDSFNPGSFRINGVKLNTR